MSFPLVPKLVTLNDLERRKGPYFALFHRIRYPGRRPILRKSGWRCRKKVHVRYLISWWVSCLCFVRLSLISFELYFSPHRSILRRHGLLLQTESVSACRSVCLSWSWVMQNGWTDRDAVWDVDSRKHALHEGEHWRHLANTIQRSMCGGDAAFCQDTFTTCRIVLFNLIPFDVYLFFIFRH